MVNNISKLHIVDYDKIQSGVITQALQFTPPPFQLFTLVHTVWAMCNHESSGWVGVVECHFRGGHSDRQIWYAPPSTRYSLSPNGASDICNHSYICIPFNGISRMNVLAWLLHRSVSYFLCRSIRMCTILPAGRSTVGRQLGPFVSCHSPVQCTFTIIPPASCPLPTSGVLNLSGGTKRLTNMPFRVGCHNPH